MGSTIIVKNSAELSAALKVAKGGETILLQNNGEKYSLTTYNSVNPSSTVTITSADPSNPATFETLRLSGSSNLHINDVEFNSNGSTRAEWLYDINITNSSNIAVTNSKMTSFADGVNGYAGVAAAENLGTISNSSSITFSGNTISNYQHGLAFKNVDNLTISNNDISQMQGDSIRLVQVKDTLVEGNYIHDIIGSTYDKTHVDMIQVWSTNTTEPTVNLTIRGNVLDAGDGAGTQAIFMRNEAVDGGDGKDIAAYNNPAYYYQNITVENNLIYNGHHHGINVPEANGVTIKNNTLILNNTAGMILTAEEGIAEVSPPTIGVSSKSTNVVIENNIGTIRSTIPADAVVTNNLEVNYTSPNLPNYVDNLFANAKSGAGVDLAGLQTLPGGLAEQMGVGSTLTQFDTSPDKLTALYSVKVYEGHENVLVFDASLSANNKGLLSDKNAQYIWDFGDGHTQTGKLVTHSFDTYGRHDVKLTVISGGEVSTFTAKPVTKDPVVLDIDFKDGKLADASAYTTKVTMSAGGQLVDGVSDKAYHISQGNTLEVTRGQAQIYNLDQFSVSFDYKRSMVAGDDGTIFQIQKAFGLVLKTTGALEFSLTDNTGATIKLTTAPIMTDSKWHQITLSYDSIGDAVVIYVDGNEAGRTDAAGITNPHQSWGMLFGHYAFGNSADGYIDNIKMTSDPTSAAEAKALYNGMLDDLGLSVKVIGPVLPSMDSFSYIYHGTDNADKGVKWNKDSNYIDLKGGDDVISTGAGKDWILGGDGDDRISSGDGDDVIIGGAGKDTLNGGNGNDYIVADKDDLVVNGGSGTDTLFYSSEGELDFGGLFTVYHIEKFDMTNNLQNTLKLDWRDILQSDDDSLFVFGDSNDSVTLQDSGRFVETGKVVQDGQEFTHYNVFLNSKASGDLYISSDIDMIIRA